MSKRTIFPSTHFNSFLTFFSSSSYSPHKSIHTLPNYNISIASLQSCASTRNLSKGKQLHSYMIINGLLTTQSSTTSLINMYSKCHKMDYALRVFDTSILDHNVFTYNAIIAGFVYNDLLKPAFVFYSKMKEVGLMPDKYTFPCVIKACSDFLDSWMVKKIHGEVFKFGLDSHMIVRSALVHCYLGFELVGDAQVVFDELSDRDVVMWSAMICGCMRIGEFGKVSKYFKRMGEEGCFHSRFTVTAMLSVFAATDDLANGRGMHGNALKMGYLSNVEVSNALIDMYGKCKCMNEALMIFEDMGERDLLSWNTIINVHDRYGDPDVSLILFYQMLRSGFQPDIVTLASILPVCSCLGALKHGREIHGYMITSGLGMDRGDKGQYRSINNAVMDMYAKCGNMKEAQLVFENTNFKDVASWNIMILGYGMHGFGKEALDLFFHICESNLMSDEITCLGVLSACSHVGFITQGRDFFHQMPQKYGIIPNIKHYTCLIDMLGRAGLLEEAYELISAMPIQSNSVAWRAFLAGCRVHGNATLAEVAAQKVMDLEPEHCGSYVMMSNVYGAGGRYDEVLEMRENMVEQNVKKTPGCSWIELGSKVHVFGNQPHLEYDFLYAELKSLISRVHEHGYEPAFFNGTPSFS